jgi:multiple sugar transport system ATP-binding protein
MSIRIDGVHKRFGSVAAVNGVSVTIEDGEFFVMLGPSGCGKTTTLRMIAGLELPSGGRIEINGRDVTYVEPRHRDIAMAFQDYGLYPHLTVAQNIEFPLKVRGMDRGQRRRKVAETAERLDIGQLLDRRPGQLSGGQRQRVSLARALVRNPRVFLMDEPLSNLDAKLRAAMRAEIKKLVTTLGITTVYVTHDQVEAMAMADRIAVMNRGDMVQVAPPIEIYERPATYFVADFIGSPAMNLFEARREPDGRITCPIQLLADALPGDEHRSVDGKIDAAGRFFLGIRPEHLGLCAAGTAGSIAADIEYVEPLGQTTNIYLDAGGTRLTVVADRAQGRTGERVGVLARPDKLRVVARDRA